MSACHIRSMSVLMLMSPKGRKRHNLSLTFWVKVAATEIHTAFCIKIRPWRLSSRLLLYWVYVRSTDNARLSSAGFGSALNRVVADAGDSEATIGNHIAYLVAGSIVLGGVTIPWLHLWRYA